MKVNKETIGAITALIVAVGALLTTFTDSGEEKADLAYELLKQRIDYIEKHLETQPAEARYDNELREMLRMLIIQRTEEVTKGITTPRDKPPSGFAEDIVDLEKVNRPTPVQRKTKLFKASPKLHDDLDVLLDQRGLLK